MEEWAAHGTHAANIMKISDEIFVLTFCDTCAVAAFDCECCLGVGCNRTDPFHSVIGVAQKFSFVFFFP